MKSLPPFLILLFMTFTAIGQQTNYADFPVTTNSSQALKYYSQGVNELCKVHLAETFDNINKALGLDPDFFMPNYIMAMLNVSRPDRKPFKSFAYKAIHSKNLLNESEKLLQQVLIKLWDNPKADVTQYGEKLVTQNPHSFLALSLLANFQGFIKDYESANKSCQAILHLKTFPVLVYNSMGKNYMRMNQMDKARDSFEKCIKAAPGNAYAYNSIGDYYVEMKDFNNAYDNYMKAYKIDRISYKFPHKEDLKGKPDMTNF